LVIQNYLLLNDWIGHSPGDGVLFAHIPFLLPGRYVPGYAIKDNACRIIIAHNHPSGNNKQPKRERSKDNPEDKRGRKSSWYSVTRSHNPYPGKRNLQKFCGWKPNI